MNDSRPVTVLMSVYNGERYLREAIESILNQTFADFEFLIVNDGSTDASQSIIAAYDDPRIRLVNNPTNIGLAKSLNRGMRLAKGMFVARQDADDISEPERLERQTKFLQDNPQIALVGSWYREIEANGRLRDQVRLPADQTELQWALLFYCPFVHSGVMLRKTLFWQEIGLYNEAFLYAEDHELWLRTSRHHLLTNYPAYLVRYRLNPHSMSETYGELTNKGIWLTTTAVASLLGWGDQDTTSNELHFRKMFNLLYGAQVAVSPDEIDLLTATIWQLHHAFSAAYQLDEPRRERHQASLRRHLCKRYVYIAHDYLNKNWPAKSWQIYGRAIRGRPQIFFTVRSALLLGKLLLIWPLKLLWSWFKADKLPQTDTEI
jgi:glycosyltransferase involved in cell wall biosynthesis